MFKIIENINDVSKILWAKNEFKKKNIRIMIQFPAEKQKYFPFSFLVCITKMSNDTF